MARSSRSGSHDFESESDAEGEAAEAALTGAAGTVTQASQIVVDAILGWRWPLSDQEKKAKQ